MKCADINLAVLQAVTFLLFFHSLSVFQISETFLLDEVSDSPFFPLSVCITYSCTHLADWFKNIGKLGSCSTEVIPAEMRLISKAYRRRSKVTIINLIYYAPVIYHNSIQSTHMPLQEKCFS